MPTETFASKVADWAEKTEIKQTEVLHASLRDLDAEIDSHIPVVTGNTRNSRAVSTLGPPALEWQTKKFRDPADQINNAIAGVAVGEKAWLGLRAPWGQFLEPTYAIMRLSAQRWSQIVDTAVSRLRR